MNLKGLAKLAGVSVSTVSRVVNKNDVNAASEEVRNKIWDLVHQTGYTPNRTAQDLKLGASSARQEKKHSITCIFARTPNGKADPFFSQIYHAIEHECIKNGYDVIGVLSVTDLKNNSDHLPEADGIIVLGRYSHSLLRLLQAKCKNVVYTGLNAIGDPYDQIICDGYEAAKTAVRYLNMLGHRSIGYIGEKSSEARYRGYYDAMQELRLPLQKEYMIESEQSLKGGYLSGLKIMDTPAVPPTAIFCANDNTAIGVLKAMHERGINVPENISVISIDNTEMCQYSSPTLTSIHIPKEDLGKLTVKTMIDRMEGGHFVPIKIEVPFTLISRESCARPESRPESGKRQP